MNTCAEPTSALFLLFRWLNKKSSCSGRARNKSPALSLHASQSYRTIGLGYRIPVSLHRHLRCSIHRPISVMEVHGSVKALLLQKTGLEILFPSGHLMNFGGCQVHDWVSVSRFDYEVSPKKRLGASAMATCTSALVF